MNRRVLVTGGTGFVGSHTVDEYLKAGWIVRALVRNPARLTWLNGLNIEIVRGTLTDVASLAAASEGCDLIVHCAGLTKAVHAREYYRINADATRDLVRVARQNGVRRFVLCSSQAAAGPSFSGVPTREDDEPHPVSEYGRSKLEGERQLRQEAGEMEWVVLRPPAIIGPRDEQFVPLFRAVVHYGIYPRFGKGKRRYSFASVHDVARALLIGTEAESGINQVYFVARTDTMDWADAAAIIAHFVDRKARPLPLNKTLLRIAGSVADAYASLRGKPALLGRDKLREILAAEWVCSVEKIREAWGFECTWSSEQTLHDTYESYRMSGWL